MFLFDRQRLNGRRDGFYPWNLKRHDPSIGLLRVGMNPAVVGHELPETAPCTEHKKISTRGRPAPVHAYQLVGTRQKGRLQLVSS